jgi:hypothetical protein
MVSKYYEAFPNKAYENLAEAIADEYKRCEYGCNISKWVDEQQEAYMTEEWDYERIRTIIWELKNSNLIVALKTKLKLDINFLENDINRAFINKLIRSKKLNKEEKKDVKELISAFEKDLEHDRLDWANIRAWDDFNDMYGQLDNNRREDDEVADFFNISKEITGYENHQGEEVETKCIIGFCQTCDEPIRKEDLFAYKEENASEDCQDQITPGTVGYCDNCGTEIELDDIKDEELKMTLVL